MSQSIELCWESWEWLFCAYYSYMLPSILLSDSKLCVVPQCLQIQSSIVALHCNNLAGMFLARILQWRSVNLIWKWTSNLTQQSKTDVNIVAICKAYEVVIMALHSLLLYSFWCWSWCNGDLPRDIVDFFSAIADIWFLGVIDIVLHLWFGNRDWLWCVHWISFGCTIVANRWSWDFFSTRTANNSTSNLGLWP